MSHQAVPRGETDERATALLTAAERFTALVVESPRCRCRVLRVVACLSWKAPQHRSSANYPSREGMSMRYQRSFYHGHESLSTTFTLSLLTSTRVASDPRWHLEWMRCIINGSLFTSNRVNTDFHSHPRTQGHD